MTQRHLILLLLSATVLSSCAGLTKRKPEYPIVYAPVSNPSSSPSPTPKAIATSDTDTQLPPPEAIKPKKIETTDVPPLVKAETASAAVAVKVVPVTPVITTLPTLLDAGLTESLTRCSTIANRQPVTLMPEAEAIAQSGGALRKGAMLKVGAAQFEDRANAPQGPVSYRYVASYRGLSADLIQYSEGSVTSFILLNRHTGAQARLSDVPTPSPNARYFASAVVKRFDFSGIEIFEDVDGSWVQRAKLSDAAAPCDLHWTSGDSLAVRIWNTGARRDAMVQPINQVWTTTIH
jgi:hypothetical protein